MRFLTLLCCFLVSSVSIAKDFKIGIVDLQKIFTEYPGTKEANKKFSTMTAKKQQELVDSQDELKDLDKELKNSSSVLSTKQRKNKEKEFATKYQALQRQEEQVRADLATKQLDMKTELLEKIKAIVAKVAKDAGVDLILDSE